MNQNSNKGSMIILTIIGIATLLVAVIGATFAYFSVTVKYDKVPTPAVVETSTMLITFETKNELIYKGAIPGRPSLSTNPEAKEINNTLKFTLTSATNMTVNTPYNVYLVIDSNDAVGATEGLKDNDFVTDNLVYLMTQERNVTSAATTNGTAGSVGSQYFKDGALDDLFIKDDYNGDGTINDNELVGVIKAGLPVGEKILIATGNIGSHASIDTWTLEVWLRETGQEQNEDQGKVLKAHVEVEPVNQDPITHEPGKVNTTTNTTP